MGMIRVVVFDFDGTLADTNAIKEECSRRAVAGMPDGASALGAALKVGGDRYKIFAEVARRVAPNCEPGAIKMQARMLVESYSCCCSKGIIAAAERRGARQTLAGLAERGIHVWVLSATPDRYLRDVLRRRGLLRQLCGSYGSSVTKEKGLLKIMARERVTRSALLLVGDGHDDQRAARTVGVRFAAVTAENRIAGKGRYGMRDLRPLVPLIDHLNAKPIRRWTAHPNVPSRNAVDC
jgi:phosphoglycolate phosphatase-like HAD superfamily hydrolase